jgi:hypothetical protein
VSSFIGPFPEEAPTANVISTKVDGNSIVVTVAITQYQLDGVVGCPCAPAGYPEGYLDVTDPGPQTMTVEIYDNC